MKAKKLQLGVAAPTHFTMRTPLLPSAEFFAWSDGLEAASSGGSERALAKDIALLRERLRAIVARPEVRDALFVASPDLDHSLPEWLSAPDSARGQKVERSLVRYLSRMTGRCTPFGLFSGISSGRVAAKTRLEVAAQARYSRHTRLDNDYLFALCEELGAVPEIREQLPLRPNTSLSAGAGRLRYAEARLAGKVRSYHLVAVEPTDYLLATLERARDGALPLSLAQALVADNPDIPLADARAFINQLIDAQLLVHDLAPAVTGQQPVHGVLETLQQTSPTHAAVLAAAQQAIEQLDSDGPGADPARYRDIADHLQPLPTKVELNRLFQVDMVKPAPDATLGERVVQELQRGIEVLRRMTPRRDSDGLDEFRRQFADRYEGREVPLLQVLDEESGIGFRASRAPQSEATPLLAGLALPAAPPRHQARWSPRESHLLARVHEVVASGGRELSLTDDDLRALEVPKEQAAILPDAFCCMPTLVGGSAAEVDRGRFRLLLSAAFGPSGARLSGRFCHASDDILDQVREHIRAEEALRPKAVFAEIAHLPEGRIGNILCRPVLRDYEISFLGLSGAPRDRQLALSDLTVRIDGGRVVLRSRSLGRDVIPRLSTAHNYGLHSLGLYRFLCELQNQDGDSVGWDWGPLADAPFLPRVTCGRMVFARARWLLRRPALEPLAEAMAGSKKATTPEALLALRGLVFQAAQRLRETYQLPRFVVVADGDNELPVDFDNALCVDSFAQLVKNRAALVLHEDYPGLDELVAYGPEGAFCHELVLMFVREQPAAAADTSSADQARSADDRLTDAVAASAAISEAAASPVVRRFAPDSEWLYAKLYTGTATADDVLRDVIAPLSRDAIARGVAHRWHFIRYGDPDWHLRVRFCGDPVRLRTELLPLLRHATAPLVDQGAIWRLQLDTYEREVERYGGSAGIELAEELFWADSDAVVEIVELLSGDEGAEARWRLTVRGADMLLDDLGFDLPAKHRIMAQASDSFAREFRADTTLHKQLGNKFRAEYQSLVELLERDPQRDAEHDYQPGFEILDRRSERLRALAPKLRAAPLTEPLESIVWSYIHMHANRLLRSSARAQELVIYTLLRRYYDSLLSRKGR